MLDGFTPTVFYCICEFVFWTRLPGGCVVFGGVAKAVAHMKILEEFWYGNIQPQEQESYWLEEHRDLVKLYEYNEQLLMETLNDGQKDRLQRMKDVVKEMAGPHRMRCFYHRL